MKNLTLAILAHPTLFVASMSWQQQSGPKPRPNLQHKAHHNFIQSKNPKTTCRRDAIFKLCIGTILNQQPLSHSASAATSTLQPNNNLSDYGYINGWHGTSLSILSPSQTASLPGSTFPMGRWPDPVLRRTANLASPSLMGTKELRDIACKLRRTARENGAVGLAAQQCGIDLSLIYLDETTSKFDFNKYLPPQIASVVRPNTSVNNPSLTNTCNDNSTTTDSGVFLINPRIIARSPETQMTVWNEKCLVLPPTITATVLRDSIVTIRYETLQGFTETITLKGEAARAVQHEMDHDRGILLLDHMGLDELETEEMRRIEMDGHSARMLLAFERAT